MQNRRHHLRNFLTSAPIAVECGVGYASETAELAVIRVRVTERTEKFAHVLDVLGHNVSSVSQGSITVTF